MILLRHRQRDEGVNHHPQYGYRSASIDILERYGSTRSVSRCVTHVYTEHASPLAVAQRIRSRMRNTDVGQCVGRESNSTRGLHHKHRGQLHPQARPYRTCMEGEKYVKKRHGRPRSGLQGPGCLRRVQEPVALFLLCLYFFISPKPPLRSPSASQQPHSPPADYVPPRFPYRTPPHSQSL